MTQYLRRVLRAADVRDPHAWSYDDIKVLDPWPDSVLEFFLSLGVVREIEPSSLVWLWECEEPDWAEPVWLPDAVNGGRVMGFCQCGHEWCGVHVVETDRRRQWAPSIERIVALVGELAGCAAEPIVDVPSRVWSLGSVAQGDERRDVFVVRGANWRDAGAVVAAAPRLTSSAQAAVLCMGTPPVEKWLTTCRTVVALDELLAIKRGRVNMAVARLFEDQPQRLTASGPGGISIPLTQAELEILTALAEAGDEAQLVVDLVAASGHKRDAVMRATRRLIRLGLAERPGASRRKGIAVTERGLRRVGRLPKTA